MLNRAFSIRHTSYGFFFVRNTLSICVGLSMSTVTQGVAMHCCCCCYPKSSSKGDATTAQRLTHTKLPALLHKAPKYCHKSHKHNSSDINPSCAKQEGISRPTQALWAKARNVLGLVAGEKDVYMDLEEALARCEYVTTDS